MRLWRFQKASKYHEIITTKPEMQTKLPTPTNCRTYTFNV